MKKQLLFITNRKEWIKYYTKFKNVRIRIQQLIASGKLTESQFNKLVKKLNRAYSKLNSLQFNSSLRLAGTSLAIMLAATNLSAQPFVEQTKANTPLDGTYLSGRSSPSFVDIDNDGDFDLFIGEQHKSTYFENTGTASAPIFTSKTNPFGTLLTVSNKHQYIDFVDIDKDGDFDAFVGDKDGFIRFLENTGTATAATFIEKTGASNPFDGEDVGHYAKPTFIDIDNDGDFDAFIGRKAGDFVFYKNIGNASIPSFATITAALNPLNGNDVGIYSSPDFVDLDNDGDFDLLSGEDYGKMYYYENTGTVSAPVFTAKTGTENPFDAINIGQFASPPRFVDIDNDGDYDLFSGKSTNATYYKNTSQRPVVSNVGIANEISNKIAIYPNPATSLLTIETEVNFNSIEIIDLTGKTVKTIVSNTRTISVGDLPKGMYVLKLQSNSGVSYSRFVKE